MSEYQMLNAISEYVDEHREEAVSFLQELVRTPSISLNEAEVTQVIADKMRWAGFDSVYVDSLHDVMGTIEGVGNRRSILFNGHIDHVPVGDMVNPYSGEIMEGAIYGVDGKVVCGRGASDMKASVAAMVIAGSLLNDLGIKLAEAFKVAAVSQEEIGGAGTVTTIEKSQFLGDFVIIGGGDEHGSRIRSSGEYKG
jgi:acetylornithine deacetylase/succinyl-diaminopimelate desuccinylase-like protein